MLLGSPSHRDLRSCEKTCQETAFMLKENVPGGKSSIRAVNYGVHFHDDCLADGELNGLSVPPTMQPMHRPLGDVDRKVPAIRPTNKQA